MKKVLRASMNRLGLGHIAKRLLDDKKKTQDVTPPLHITPCGFHANEDGDSDSVPRPRAASPKQGARLAAATKGAKRPVRKPAAKKAAAFQKFFKKRGK